MTDEPQINGGCPSDYQLDGFWLEGKPADHPVGLHLSDCERCRGRLDEMERVQDRFLTEVYPQNTETVVERASEGGFRRWLFFWTGKPRLAVTGAFLLLIAAMVVLWTGLERQRDSKEYVGIKGTVGLEVWCQRGDQTFRVHQGARLLPDDAIRFVAAPPRAGFLMIISVDAKGKVSRYYPAASEQAARVEGGETALPGSTVLDESQGPERIFVLFSDEVFEFEKVREAAAQAWQAAGAPEVLVKLPMEAAQTSLLFKKGK